MGCWWALFDQRADAERQSAQTVIAKRESFAQDQKAIAVLAAQARAAAEVADRLAALPQERTLFSRALADIRGRLMDGMWLRAVVPVTDPKTGALVALRIRGYGFRDKLKAFDRENASSIEVFRDRLGESPLFDNAGTKIIFEGFMDAEWAKEFTIEIRLRPVAAAQSWRGACRSPSPWRRRWHWP